MIVFLAMFYWSVKSVAAFRGGMCYGAVPKGAASYFLCFFSAVGLRSSALFYWGQNENFRLLFYRS